MLPIHWPKGLDNISSLNMSWPTEDIRVSYESSRKPVTTLRIRGSRPKGNESRSGGPGGGRGHAGHLPFPHTGTELAGG